MRYYLEEAKSRLQEEAFERAVRNKRFIEDQIGRTVDPLTRDRLYGSRVTVNSLTIDNGQANLEVKHYYLYRWVDVVDAEQAMNKTVDTAAFKVLRPAGAFLAAAD